MSSTHSNDSAPQGDDDLTLEELADGLALWEEHKPTTREDWLRIAERWHEKGLEPPDNPSPLFGALYDAVGRARRAEGHQ